MKPLRIEFNLVTPVSGMTMPVHLDALLAYAVTQETLGGTIDLKLSQMSIRQIGENLPLMKESKEDLWCWKSSSLIGSETLAHEMRMWTRKTETTLIATMTGDRSLEKRRETVFPLKPFTLKIETSRGMLKNHYQFIPVRHVKQFTAFCIGDQDRIYDLLQTHITHIGARGRVGFGRIAQEENGTIQSIHVAVDERAETMWQRRILPWAKEGYTPIQAAHKAPYWAAENRTISYIPEEILI